MARKVELVNDSGSDWYISCMGNLKVVATSTLDITDMVPDSELIRSIQCGLKDVFDGDHYLKVNDVNLTAAQSANYLTYEQNGYSRPRRIKQNEQPTPDVGELLIWIDDDDADRIYLVYNDVDSGVGIVEMPVP